MASIAETSAAFDSIGEALLGAWSLASWDVLDDTGAVVGHPLGPDAEGRIGYHRDGQMSAQLMSARRARFASDDWSQASPSEMASGWSTYFGYYGSYTVDEIGRTVTHHVEGSWFPNLVGLDQRRECTFEGPNRLILLGPSAAATVRITWDRIGRARSL